jgi:hypothetical protein
MRETRLLFIPAVLCALVSAASPAVSASSGKTLTLRKVQSAVVIDGAVEPLWSQADSVSDFVQFAPYNGKEPSRKTVAKLLTTDRAIYCLMLCYDSRENI